MLDEARLLRFMNENGFIHTPSWDGLCRYAVLLQALRTRYGNGLMPRLVVRLTEVAQLAQWRLSGDPANRTQGIMKDKGIGLVQAPRGMLAHSVALALVALKGDMKEIETQARQIIHAIDPCVGYRLHIATCESGVEE
ncbi:MAG: hypothetical protein L3J26_02190 [Candidatus Polarisedimenticolaceae bacterium]|nr:hypothetical protein [Candidatus Polarisedimenticolaceae bacterium]